MLPLEDHQLFRTQCYINGEWTDGDTDAVIEVTNPATGEVLGGVPELGAAETRRAVGAAQLAFDEWRFWTAEERANLLLTWQNLILENQKDLAVLMTAEQGKPLEEAEGEIAYAASFIEWFAEEGRRVYGDIIPAHKRENRIMVIKGPVGVCAAITPWNFPAAMITRKAGPALAAGCTMVVKPASATPFSALALAELAHRAGIPPGVFNVVTGPSSEIGEELTGNSAVRKLTFTGSTETGKQLMAQCADTVKKISLELGGNAPFIVFDDADPDAAVEGAMASKYRNTGQTCVCANRFLVQVGIHDAFADKLAEAAAGLSVGDGLKGKTDQGPLIDEDAVRKVERLIADAVERGAKVVTGGQRHSLGGTFFQPTVLANAAPDMDLAREEIFGPVAPIFRFGTEAEALEMANDTEYGLAAYFFTRDMARIWRMAEGLEYGIQGINTGLISTAAAPFGGVKQSGIGREGSKYGIDEFLEMKYLCMGGIQSCGPAWATKTPR